MKTETVFQEVDYTVHFYTGIFKMTFIVNFPNKVKDT